MRATRATTARQRGAVPAVPSRPRQRSGAVERKLEPALADEPRAAPVMVSGPGGPATRKGTKEKAPRTASTKAGGRVVGEARRPEGSRGGVLRSEARSPLRSPAGWSAHWLSADEPAEERGASPEMAPATVGAVAAGSAHLRRVTRPHAATAPATRGRSVTAVSARTPTRVRPPSRGSLNTGPSVGRSRSPSTSSTSTVYSDNEMHKEGSDGDDGRSTATDAGGGSTSSGGSLVRHKSKEGRKRGGPKMTASQVASAFNDACPARISMSALTSVTAALRWVRRAERCVHRFRGLLHEELMLQRLSSLLPDGVLDEEAIMTIDTVDELLDFVRGSFCPRRPVRYYYEHFVSMTKRQQGVGVRVWLQGLMEVCALASDAGAPLPDAWQTSAFLSGVQYPTLAHKLADVTSLSNARELLKEAQYADLLADDPLMQSANSLSVGKTTTMTTGSHGQFGRSWPPSRKAQGERSVGGDTGGHTKEAEPARAAGSGPEKAPVAGGLERAPPQVAGGRPAGGVGRCFKCGKFGHKAAVCRSSSKPGKPAATAGPSGTTTTTNVVAVIASGSRPPYIKVGVVSHGMVTALADSGADVSVITTGTVTALGLSWMRTTGPEGVALATVSSFDGSRVPLLGTVELDFVALGRHVVTVIDGPPGPLFLGRDVGRSMLVTTERVEVNGVAFELVAPEVPIVATLKHSDIMMDEDVDADTLGIVVPSLHGTVETEDDTPLVSESEFFRIAEMDSAAIAQACQDLWASRRASLPALKGQKMHIDLVPGARAVAVPMVFRRPEFDARLSNQIDLLHNLGVVEPCASSEWRSRAVLVPKPGGEWRFVTDFRALNAVTVLNRQPMPNVNDMLARLGGSKYFGKLDAKSGFHQVEIDEASRSYTAFADRRGLWQYCRMPMGLVNSPAVFQQIVQGLLVGLDGVLVYMDDVLIHAPTWQQYLRTMFAVLSRLREAGVTLNDKKCVFAATELKFLGHMVHTQGVGVDPQKIEALHNMPVPSNRSELRSVLGMLGFYRRFVEGFADKAVPLTALLAEDRKFIWTAEQDHALSSLKEALVTATVLAHPDFGRQFVVRSDASGRALGAVLCQRDDSGALRPLAFYSRQFSAAERKYDVRERELLALGAAIRQWESFLMGAEYGGV